MSTTLRALAATAWLALLGCGSAEGTEALVLVLGQGETAYAELDDGTELPLVAGPQGGHHVWIALRAEGLSGPAVELLVDALPVGEPEPPRRLPVRTTFRQQPEGGWERVGWPAEIQDAPCTIGRDVVLRVTLRNGGREAVDERRIVPADGPGVGSCAR